jgi:replicative DNA helicase
MNAPADYDIAQLKLPPHSLEAEQSVIGGLIIANEAWDRVADMLTDGDFYRPEHRLIFRRMAQLVEANQPIDIVTLPDALAHADELDRAGGFAYLAEIACNTPSAANIRAYAAAVRERADLRRLIQTCADISDLAYNPAGRRSSDIVDEAQSKIIGLSHSSNGEPVTALHSVRETLLAIDERAQRGSEITGIPTGFSVIDARTLGLQPGDLIVIAGRPAMGKTTFAVNVAESALAHGVRCLIFSMEMPRRQLTERMLSNRANLSLTKIRKGQLNQIEYDAVLRAGEEIAATDLIIDDRSALTVTQMRAMARRYKPGLIVVDYLQLASGRGESREQEVSGLSRGLKAIAKELEIPVIALSQLSRNVESRPDKRPRNSDLRDSGGIEQDADVILMLYRDEVYNSASPAKNICEVACTKFRNGEIGVDRLRANLQFSRFENLPNEYSLPLAHSDKQRSRDFEYS